MKELGIGIALFAFALTSHAQGSQFAVPLQSKGTQTYYVRGHIQGSGATTFLVDTGSGYSVINEETLARLQETGDAVFLKELRGIMADGSTRVVPLYRISGINLGACMISDIEAAIFPARSRQILGLSALRKVAPFSFSFEPPSLSLSNCMLAQAPPAPAQEVVAANALEDLLVPASAGEPATPATVKANLSGPSAR